MKFRSTGIVIAPFRLIVPVRSGPDLNAVCHTAESVSKPILMPNSPLGALGIECSWSPHKIVRGQPGLGSYWVFPAIVGSGDVRDARQLFEVPNEPIELLSEMLDELSSQIEIDQRDFPVVLYYRDKEYRLEKVAALAAA